MSNYIKTTDFAIKDTYASGDPRKIAKGADVDTEFNNIATAITSKFDTSSLGVAGGAAPLSGGALVTKTFQWTTTAYTDAANTFTAAQVISSSSIPLTVTDTSASDQWTALIQNTASTNGAGIKILGNGSTTPSKTIRVQSGTFQWVNDAYTTVIASLTDAGAFSAGSLAGNGAGITALNASNINAGSIPAANVPSAAVTQYASSMKTQNITGRSGYAVTVSTAAPSGGADGDIWYVHA